MAELALEPALADRPARVVVERGSVQAVRDPFEHRRAQLVARGAEQTAAGIDQRGDGLALALDGGTEIGAVAAAREHVGLGAPQRVAGVEQLGQRLPWVRTSWLTAQAAADGFFSAATAAA